MTTFSYSRRRLFGTCRLAYRRRYLDKVPEVHHPGAESGTQFHDVADVLLKRGLTEDEAVTVFARRAAVLEEDVGRDLRVIARRALALGWPPPFPTDVQDAASELDLAVDPDGHRCDYWASEARVRGRLDQVYRENGGRTLVVRDWKTGRVIDRNSGQGRVYSYLGACQWPDVEEVVVETYWLRYSMKPRVEIFDAEQVRGEVREEFEALELEVGRCTRRSDWEPRLSLACRNCSWRHLCPPFAEELKPIKVIEDEKEARRAAAHLLILEGQAQTLRDTLRGWVLANGTLDLGDEELGFLASKGRKRVTDARELARLIRTWPRFKVSDERLWQALSFTQRELTTLLGDATKHLARIDRQEAREAFLAAARERHLIEEQHGSAFKRREKGIEEEPEGEEDYDA